LGWWYYINRRTKFRSNVYRTGHEGGGRGGRICRDPGSPAADRRVELRRSNGRLQDDVPNAGRRSDRGGVAVQQGQRGPDGRPTVDDELRVSGGRPAQ